MNNTEHSLLMCVDHNKWWRHGTCGTQQITCQVWFIFYATWSHKNVQQHTIKGNYVALPHRMAKLSTEEHNEHRLVEKYEV